MSGISLRYEERLFAQWQGTFDWAPLSPGIQVNPADQTVIADTGPLAAGCYLIHVCSWASAQSTVEVRRRDAANATTLRSQRRSVAANSNDDFVFGNKILLADQERIVVAQIGALTGSEQVSIFYVEVPLTPLP